MSRKIYEPSLVEIKVLLHESFVIILTFDK